MIRWVLLSALLPAMFACQSEQEARRPGGYATARRPIPRPEPRTTHLKRVGNPTRMVVIVSAATRDTNADGYGDRVDVSAMLFDDSGPDPVFADGDFLFELVRTGEGKQDGETLATWVFDAKAVRRAEGPTMFGLPGYRFELDIGPDARRMQSSSANLLTGFRPASGAASIVPTQDQRLVRVGPVG